MNCACFKYTFIYVIVYGAFLMHDSSYLTGYECKNIMNTSTINLDDFQYARCQIITALKLAFLVFKPLFQQRVFFFQLTLGRLQCVIQFSA